MACRSRRFALFLATVMVGSLGSLHGPQRVSALPVLPRDEAVDLGTPDAEVVVPTSDDITVSSAGRITATATAKPRTTTVSSGAVGLFGMPPVRLFDSRSGDRLEAGATQQVQIRGVAGVPASAAAAVINLTVDGPRDRGFIVASPCGAAFDTSTINFVSNQAIANLAVVGLGDNGAICLTASASTHVIVDLSGYVAKGGQLFSPVTPSRIVDSRSGAPIEPFVATPVQITGANGVPTNGVAAASVNLTVTAPAGNGYAMVFPCDAEVPVASNVNFAKGQSAANGAVVDLDDSGRVCVLSSVRTHVILDVSGWFGSTGTEVQASAPLRLRDTRLDGGSRIQAGQRIEVASAPGALGSVLNLTVTSPADNGYLIVWPCDGVKPPTSALNYLAGQTIANAALAPVSTSGLVCIESSETTHLVVDRTAVLGLAGTGGLDPTGTTITDWALTQTGAVYAAMNPYRFGDSKYGKAWDCAAGEASCSKVDTQGKSRTTTVGSFAYDCSGLVVAAWLRAGVDLVKLGASWTEPMLQKLPRVTRATAQAGDLVMFDFDQTDADPVDHVGMYLSPTEMVHAGTCPGGTSAVCRTTINWKNVVAVLRPPTS